MLKRRIAAFSAAIVLAVCALVAEAVLDERNAAIDRARMEAANLSAGFEEQIEGTLNAVSNASAALKRRIEAGTRAQPRPMEEFNRRAHDPGHGYCHPEC